MICGLKRNLVDNEQFIEIYLEYTPIYILLLLIVLKIIWSFQLYSLY